MESRWLRWIGTGVIAIVAVGSFVSTAAGGGQHAWKTKACADDAGARTQAARSTAPIALTDLGRQAWFRLDPRLDRAGALEGQRLALGLDGARTSRIMDLPPESFAAGPFGRVILVGSDDGATTHLAALDVTAECAWPVGEEVGAVVRRGTIDPEGQTVYEMRVDRVTRDDLGIWARPLDGTEPAVQVVEPIELDERFGRTFSTEFTWDLAGRRLAIQSCAELACRTRVFDPAGGSLSLVADEDLGTIVGLAGDELVSYAACKGWPCPVVAVSLATGERQVLSDGAAMAILASTSNGPRLVHEILGETGIAVRAISLDGTDALDLGPVQQGLRLHAGPRAAESATEVPSGWVLLGPEGRFPDTGPTAQTQLRRVEDGATLQFVEVAQ